MENKPEDYKEQFNYGSEMADLTNSHNGDEVSSMLENSGNYKDYTPKENGDGQDFLELGEELSEQEIYQSNFSETSMPDIIDETDYRREYNKLVSDLEKQCLRMRASGSDPRWLQEILNQSDRQIEDPARYQYNNDDEEDDEIDEMLMMLMLDRRRSRMERLRMTRLYRKQQEILLMNQEVLKQRHTYPTNARSPWRHHPHEEEKQFNRRGTWRGRSPHAYNGNRDYNRRYRRRIPSTPGEDPGDRRFHNSQLEPIKKVRHCRHFLKGQCVRGKTCGFIHDRSIFCTDTQKVFLGGVPQHFTPTSLRQKLTDLGFTVLNKPRVLPGFSPEVCLGSVQEAQILISKGSIMIDGVRIVVRPFKDQSLNGGIRHSVFLGGLANGTTSEMIKQELAKLDVQVVNHPVIKAGFSPQVTLKSAEETQKLVQLAKVRINGVFVNVRPYANVRKHFATCGRKMMK